MAKKKFVCSICGHVHEGNSAPDTCPVCQASSSAFTEDRSGQKKGWMHNPNSNTYIIVYSTVMVVIVATLLAVASLSLQKRQAENELQEKKSNILQSLGYSPDENPQEFDRALADFDNQVKSFVLDADGVKTESLTLSFAGVKDADVFVNEQKSSLENLAKMPCKPMKIRVENAR